MAGMPRPVKVVVFGALLLAASCAKPGPTALSSSPGAGSSTPEVSPVSPAPSVRGKALPDVLYLNVEAARKTLRRLDLKLKLSSRTTVDWLPQTVVRQRPRPGSRVVPGDMVTLTIASPPPCHPAYPDFCIPPFIPDLKCQDLRPHRYFTVLQPRDPYHFDPDKDGVGCDGYYLRSKQ